MSALRNVFGAAVMSAVIAGAGGASAAVVYDAVGDFDASTNVNPSTWNYGDGVTGASFTAYGVFTTNCFTAGLNCWTPSSGTDPGGVPTVLKNTTGGAIDFSTVVQPNDVLNVHPGASTDSIVRFTAPTSGSYNVSGFFELLDTSPSGVVVHYGTSGQHSSVLTMPGAQVPNTPGGTVDFNETVYLTQGENYYFGVGNGGSYFNDSTGLSAIITAVPEPATWAMMILGLGGIGGALRLARRKSGATALRTA